METTFSKQDNIIERLRPYLDVPGDNLIPGAAAKKVTPELIKLTTEQIESKLRLAFGQVYQLPFPETAIDALNIVGGISEKLICAEVLGTHFTQNKGEELASDNGYGRTLKKEAVEDLKMLLCGHGIYIPGIMPKPTNAELGTYAQPLVLPGVILLKPEDQPDTYTRSFSYLGSRATTTTEDNPFDYNYKNITVFD